MESNKFQLRGFLVWGICSLFFLYEFLLHTSTGTFQAPIMRDLNLESLFQFSLLSTAMFVITYGSMQIPVGIIVSQIGLKRAMMIGAFACIISTLGFAYSYTLPVAMFFRFLMGFGSAFGFICLLIAVNEWMPHRHNALFIGLSQFIGTMGPMIAAGPLGVLSHSAGVDWRFVFLVLSGVGIILFFLIAFFVESNHEKADRYIVLRRPEKISTSIFRLFSRVQPWYIAILCACVYFSVEYFSENEGRNFLFLKGIDLARSSYMITCAWVGYAIGCPLLGFLSDFFQRRKIIIVISTILGLISISTILYSGNKDFLFLAFFFLGMSASGQSVGFAAMTEQFKREFVAVGFGLVNTMITIVMAINAPAIGVLLDYVRKGSEVSLDNYILVFSMLVAIVSVAFIISVFFMKETYCKSLVDFTYLRSRKFLEK